MNALEYCFEKGQDLSMIRYRGMQINPLDIKVVSTVQQPPQWFKFVKFWKNERNQKRMGQDVMLTDPKWNSLYIYIYKDMMGWYVSRERWDTFFVS